MKEWNVQPAASSVTKAAAKAIYSSFFILLSYRTVMCRQFCLRSYFT